MSSLTNLESRSLGIDKAAPCQSSPSGYWHRCSIRLCGIGMQCYSCIIERHCHNGNLSRRLRLVGLRPDDVQGIVAVGLVVIAILSHGIDRCRQILMASHTKGLPVRMTLASRRTTISSADRRRRTISTVMWFHA